MGPTDLDSELEALVLDEDFIRAGSPEATAGERAERLARIGRANDQLRRAGEISDGTGKPAARRMRKAFPWIAAGVVVAVAIVVIVLIAR